MDLFGAYCHLGDSLTSEMSSTLSSASPTPSSASPTSSAESTSVAVSSSVPATPAATSSIISASATPTPSSSSSAVPAEDTQPPKKTNPVAIVVGISVPVALVAAAIAAFLIFRKKKEAPSATEFYAEEKGPHVSAYQARSMDSGYTTPQSDVYELMPDTITRHNLVEIGGSQAIHEMHAQHTANELPSRYSR
ncbi:hypothetical protein G6514_003324 [Epicoccum nigrum]|nr:hypothetical protein G6514_003324 [Epicoccum nigrum]